MFKDFELSDDDYKYILELCNEYSIEFLCTPFDKESVDFLEKLGVSGYKIGSPDMTNFELLEYVCQKKKPIIISTGMSTLEEIEKTVAFLKNKKSEFILLHCNSNYPAPFHNINLRIMPKLREKFNCLVGYSGHEYGISVSQAAVALGACVVERHFTLDRTMIGPDHSASLEPSGLKTLVRDIRQIEMALGTSIKTIDRGEYMNRESLGKSLVASKSIDIGENITRDKISSKSPGTGISPQRIKELIGKTAKRHINKDEQFIEDDFIKKRITKKLNLKFKHNWGIMVRPPDFKKLIDIFNPKLIEFHLTEKDLLGDLNIEKKIEQMVIFHAPEYCGHDLFDLTSEDKRISEKSLNNLKKVIDIADKYKRNFKRHEKTKIVIHPGGMYQSGPSINNDSDSDYKNLFYKNLKSNLNLINKNSNEILIENMPPFPWYFGGQWSHSIFMDAQEIITFCKNTGYRICLDVSHAFLYCNHKKIDFYNYINKLLPYTKHMHIADASSGVDGEGLQIGEGSIDFKKIDPLFKKYKETFSVEIWQGHKDFGKGFEIALKRLNKINQSL